jgi:hypothetical protein
MKRFSFPTKISILASSLILSAGAPLHAGSPRVNNLYPSGGQVGTEVQVVCSGGNLEDANGLIFDAPGFEATSVAAEKGKFTVKIKVPADARLGEHLLRISTVSGLSDLRLFFVSPFPLVEEQEVKEEPNKKQPIALGTTVYGRTQGEDQDHFEVEVKKGERLTAEVIGARLQTQSIYDSYLTIEKPDGTPLAEVDDDAFTRQDPVVSVIVPEDGKYTITIKDATNSGPGECHYLLHIGSFPRPVAVYPPGGPVGEELKVKLIGDARGPIEQTVKLPPEPDERFEIFANDGQTAPQPNYIRVSKMANVLEVEPNNVWNEATPAGTVPFAANGIIEKAKDADFFKFTAIKGQDYDLTVYARRLRSPLDPVLVIHDAKGGGIASNDDAGGPDSYLRWKAPADGDFYFQVYDQLLRGGPDFTYRVEIKQVAPRLTTWLPEMVINSSQERRAVVVPKGNRYASLVRIKRWDLGGDVKLEPAGLPVGVNVSAPIVDKTVDTVAMVFEAAPDAAPAAGVFVINPSLTEPPKDTMVAGAVEHEVDVAENGNQKAFYSVKEDRLPIAVTEEVPVKINLVQPKVPLLQNGSFNLKVIAERKADFKGAISLALLYAPPGIGSAGTVQIKEGENEGVVTISANGNAPLQKWKICVVGTIDLGKGPVWISTQLIDLEVAAPFIGGQIVRTFVDQGDSTNIIVKLDQKIAFDGKARLQLVGLPPGCTAGDQEFTKDDKEVKFTLQAGKDSPAGSHRQLFCQFHLVRDGEEMTNAFANGGILRIDKATVAQK